MIESYLTSTDIINTEPSLADYYRTSQTSWDTLKSEAWKEVAEDIRALGWDIRRLCKRLSLQDSVTKTAAFTGTISEEDILQRLRIVINASAVSGSGTVSFLFEGSDDEETYTTVTTISVTTTGNTTSVFTSPYKYYRLSISSITGITSITYSAYLIETSFERLHKYKSLEMIYRSLIALDGDVWEGKKEQYENLYKDTIQKAKFYYDADDDGEIDDDEKDKDSRRVLLRL